MKKMNKKGFTLIELLAVIVILGLLMAIAIPSVTKYITQSRKKTLTNTMGNYIAALTTEVNNLSYTFTGSNTIYAVPIECIALERGGTDPFGSWYPASSTNWAYVLVQYDDATSSYTYGFTFKDTAGYGIYPTASHKLNEGGKQILTGLILNYDKLVQGSYSGDTYNKPSGTGYAVDYSATWTGFKVVTTNDDKTTEDDRTKLVVLKSTPKTSTLGNQADGTCTLAQER